MLRTALSFCLASVLFALVSCDEYEDKILFTVYKGNESFTSTFNKSLAQQGCDKNGNFSFLTHGWMGSKTSWIPDLIGNLSVYRQGCVMFMNYSYFSDRPNYFEVITNFKNISNLVTRKLRAARDEGFSSDNMFLFGFSLGGRIVIEAALNYGPKRIAQIDTCDMAGPGFDYIYKKDPKGAAKNVQCIHTSMAGTAERNCHQNWLMGHCGKYQEAGDDLGVAYCEIFKSCTNTPMLSHSLCPYFYTAAFKHDFVADNHYKCSSSRMAKDLPAGFKMGPTETRKNSSIIGDIPAPTSKQYPYTSI